jgi:cytoskeletal protein CcmA (bactofilin family)
MPANKLPFDYRHNAGVYLSSLVTSQGSFDIQEDIVINGEFRGEVKTTGFCEISENGLVTGDIDARMITILGSIDGTCRAKDNIDVKKSAKVKGHLIAPAISIESGAQIDARCKQPSSPQRVS